LANLQIGKWLNKILAKVRQYFSANKNPTNRIFCKLTVSPTKIGCLRKFAKIVLRGTPIFAVNFAQTFLQCPPLRPHGVLGSNLAFKQNWKFAEFFAVYRKNCVFRPHPFST
jgi:hypothetical protein